MPNRRSPLPAVERGEAPDAGARRSALVSFIMLRWRGELPLRHALWWDMWCVGTTANLATSLVALLLIARDFPDAVGAAVFFAPLPYNLLLLVSVWRSAAREAEAGSGAGGAAQLAALVWIVLATLL